MKVLKSNTLSMCVVHGGSFLRCSRSIFVEGSDVFL